MVKAFGKATLENADCLTAFPYEKNRGGVS
ncbi:hypothetical protein HNO89_000639 [Sporosarcina luteola]|nr:hypothetical protein [Sporosarcina luteola]